MRWGAAVGLLLAFFCMLAASPEADTQPQIAVLSIASAAGNACEAAAATAIHNDIEDTLRHAGYDVSDAQPSDLISNPKDFTVVASLIYPTSSDQAEILKGAPAPPAGFVAYVADLVAVSAAQSKVDADKAASVPNAQLLTDQATLTAAQTALNAAAACPAAGATSAYAVTLKALDKTLASGARTTTVKLWTRASNALFEYSDTTPLLVGTGIPQPKFDTAMVIVRENVLADEDSNVATTGFTGPVYFEQRLKQDLAIWGIKSATAADYISTAVNGDASVPATTSATVDKLCKMNPLITMLTYNLDYSESNQVFFGTQNGYANANIHVQHCAVDDNIQFTYNRHRRDYTFNGDIAGFVGYTVNFALSSVRLISFKNGTQPFGSGPFIAASLVKHPPGPAAAEEEAVGEVSRVTSCRAFYAIYYPDLVAHNVYFDPSTGSALQDSPCLFADTVLRERSRDAADYGDGSLPLDPLPDHPALAGCYQGLNRNPPPPPVGAAALPACVAPAPETLLSRLTGLLHSLNPNGPLTTLSGSKNVR